MHTYTADFMCMFSLLYILSNIVYFRDPKCLFRAPHVHRLKIWIKDSTAFYPKTGISLVKESSHSCSGLLVASPQLLYSALVRCLVVLALHMLHLQPKYGENRHGVLELKLIKSGCKHLLQRMFKSNGCQQTHKFIKWKEKHISQPTNNIQQYNNPRSTRKQFKKN